MATHSVLYIHLFKNEILTDFIIGMVELSSGINATCTSDKDLTLILRIKIQEHLAFEESWLESHRTIKTGLL